MGIKNLFAAFLLLLPATSVNAQGNIGYTYDAAGNRILREPVRSRLQEEDSDSLSMDDQRMKRLSLTVTPNPTKGPVTVYVTGLEDGDACSLSLFDTLGRQLQTLSMTGDRVILDLSSLPAGCYLLAAILNEEKTFCRIIKE